MGQPARRSKRAHGKRHRRGKGGRSKHPTCIAVRRAWVVGLMLLSLIVGRTGGSESRQIMF